jgi:hypothetical protein
MKRAIFYFLILLTAFYGGAMPRAAAAENVNISCEMSDGFAAPFYKFDEIIVYLTTPKPRNKEEKLSLPHEFQYEEMQKRVEKVLRKNFANCLQSDEKNKPIVFRTWRHDDMLDDDNLVVYVKLSYPLFTLTDTPKSDVVYNANLLLSFFRAGLNAKEQLLLLDRHTHNRIIYMDKKYSRSVSEQLDYVFAIHIRPDFNITPAR